MLDSKTIEVAAQWWKNVYLKPIYENGDSGDNGPMLAMIASMSGGGRIEAKAESLKQAIVEHLTGMNRADLNVDYQATGDLANILRSVSIRNDSSVLSWKTNMSIEQGSVRVSEGYCKPYIELVV